MQLHNCSLSPFKSKVWSLVSSHKLIFALFYCRGRLCQAATAVSFRCSCFQAFSFSSSQRARRMCARSRLCVPGYVCICECWLSPVAWDKNISLHSQRAETALLMRSVPEWDHRVRRTSVIESDELWIISVNKGRRREEKKNREFCWRRLIDSIHIIHPKRCLLWKKEEKMNHLSAPHQGHKVIESRITYLIKEKINKPPD